MKIKIITFFFTLTYSCLIGQDLYRGAEVRTKADYLYGKFEVRYKPAQGDGLVSSFFTYNTELQVNVTLAKGKIVTSGGCLFRVIDRCKCRLRICQFH